MTEPVPRLRLREKIDFSKATPNCKHCNGTGINGHRVVVAPEGDEVRAPIVCRCVSRNGGVGKDKLDALLYDMQQRLADGSFGEALAADILKIPPPGQNQAIENVRARIADPDTHEMVREALTRCLTLVDARLSGEN